MTRIVEINSIEALVPHRAMWNECLARTPHASFFQSLDWLESHWRHAAKERRLRVLLMWNQETPLGVLPLVVQREETQLGTFHVVAFPLDGWGSFYGPLGADPAAVLQTGIEYLYSQKRDFDLIDLRGLPACDNDRRSLAWHCAEESFSRVAMIDLDGNWESYWESRKREANRRRNVERCERRLAEQGTIRYERYRPGGSVCGDNDLRWDLYDACEMLAAKSWQAGLQDGNTLSHTEVRDFVRDAHVQAVNAGALDLNLLFFNERPVAFVYAYHYRGYLDLMRIGFDPELAKLAPGNALWTRMIQDSFLRGDRVLDLGPTCLDYKKFWMTRVEESWRHVEYCWTPRAQALRFARSLKNRFQDPTEATNQRAKEEASEETKQEVDETVQNPCRQCTIQQDCCTQLVGLRVTQREFDRCFANVADKLIVEREGAVLVLTAMDGAACPNWKQGGCSVYDQRPRECALFPYTLLVQHQDSDNIALVYHSDTHCPLKKALLPSESTAQQLVRDFAAEAFGVSKIEVRRESIVERICRRIKEELHRIARRLKLFRH